MHSYSSVYGTIDLDIANLKSNAGGFSNINVCIGVHGCGSKPTISQMEIHACYVSVQQGFSLHFDP